MPSLLLSSVTAILALMVADALGAPPSWLSDNELDAPQDPLTVWTEPPSQSLSLKSLIKALYRFNSFHKTDPETEDVDDHPLDQVEQEMKMEVPEMSVVVEELPLSLPQAPLPLQEADKSQRFTHSIRTGWLGLRMAL